MTMVSPLALQQQQQRKAPEQSAPVAAVPFVRGALEHKEQFMDVTQALGASGVPIGPIDVPAYGFLRGVWIEVTATGGTGTVATALGDAPFSVFDELALIDVNGAPIFGPVSGFDTYAINKYGGYFRGANDPKTLPDYAGISTAGNFTFMLYIPLETNGRDALGALANLNGASTYKLRLSLAPANRVYGTQPTTLPNVRIRAFMDAWTQPTAQSAQGYAQAQTPPAHGTTSFWTKQVFNLSAAGMQSLRTTRVGNHIRDFILIYRDVSGVRNSINFAAPLDFYYDGKTLESLVPSLWRTLAAQRFTLRGAADTAGAVDTGVFVKDFMHEFDGEAGYELRDGWLETTQATRLEMNGTFGAAGTLTLLTNDVSAAGDIFVG